MSTPLACAYFVSPHGFGHAARACAVMDALHRRCPTASFHIFTQTPDWFFKQSLTFPFNYHDVETDVGMVQSSPLHEDVPATMARLEEFCNFSPEHLRPWVECVVQAACRVVLCDISPLGIAVARQAGLPAVLIENFTWDWIYDGYADNHPRMAAFAERLRAVFAQAPHRIQTEPVCVRIESALTVPPVSRAPRATPHATRAKLGIADDARLVLVSMGGIATDYGFLDTIHRHHDITFLIPSHRAAQVTRERNVLLLPWHCELYHPDLVGAADVVVGKLGYSTIAEAYNAGAAFGYVTRPRFRESPPLATFVRENMPSVELDEHALVSDNWVAAIEPLFGAMRHTHDPHTAADTIANYVTSEWCQPRTSYSAASCSCLAKRCS
jgi:hypothetical protein